VYKQLLNEAMLELSIKPNGPVLIKATDGAGADPTHPDMEFVRTQQHVYLPGSSLKGVVRAHAERIVRAFQSGNQNGQGACDPLDRFASCGGRLNSKRLASHDSYRQSCRICQLFGNTVVAGRAHFTDAMPQGKVTLEQRNGVAIDRVYGSAYGGALFNYEVATTGVFKTTIHLRNFTLSQLALVGLALRDLGDGRVGMGFGKSRGMGRVELEWGKLTLRYPLATLRAQRPPAAELLGVGTLLGNGAQPYGMPRDDRANLPANVQFADDGWLSLVAVAEGRHQIEDVFQAATTRWGAEVAHG
jgi:CRISPR-associated RAMP protein (TIGR02581 family)